jgi:solute carrier family 25 phosphate transporter 3
MSSTLPEESRIVRPSTTSPQHDLLYYAKCSICGALSSTCRWPLSPIEFIKTRMQVDPLRYPGLWAGTVRVWSQQGVRGLFSGVGPTALAYGFQVSTKYGMYEVVKDRLIAIVGPDTAYEYRGLLYVASAASAEAIADVLMCPWEMIRVRVQTSPKGTFPVKLRPALREMLRHRELYNFPFGSLGPLMGRQIPATVVNFYTFENIVEAVYKHVFTEPRDSYSTTTQLGITTASGYLAGAACAVVSHPADSLVTLMGSSGKSASQIVRETGFWALATNGLGTRMFLTGSIVSMQWFAYDGFRTMLNLGTSGRGNKTH